MENQIKIENLEQLNLSEMAQVKGGSSSNEKSAENQSTDNSQVIYINGRAYLIGKDGTIRPI